MERSEIQSSKAWRKLGLRDEEYQRICQLLGRAPNWVELGMFSVLWSEHCAYKHSKPLLKQLPTQGEHVLVGPGENAGVIAVDHLAVAFRMESHNHPSAIEPYQGAATGVGGILRDILAVGARPIALLDSLRFGSLDHPRVRYLVDGVVAGIAGYGNCVGVPTVGGEVFFDDAYRGNPLVNVMCVGVLHRDRLTLGRASGVGNAIMLVGAQTGRDGIHGASFASGELHEGSEQDRPSVQVGDPFMEKLLIEACLELLEQPGIVGIQDMGAAGITSSVAETASRAGNGAEIDVSRVPLREEGMTPYEILLSESQERMLVIVQRGREQVVEAICRKWGLEAVEIGRVTDDGMLRVRHGDQVVAEVPVRALTEEAPQYRVPSAPPEYLKSLPVFDERQIPEPRDWSAALRLVLDSPNVASKAWVYEQYDYQVRTSTVAPPGSGAAVIRLRGTSKAIALSTDGNGRYCYLDPYTGAAHAVAESARNVVCAGARPVAITNCLNLGNPEKPGVYWQLERVIQGMADACRALNTPVTGGNVSLYNETSGQAIYPTPIVGMLGILSSLDRRLPMGWSREGLCVLMLGDHPRHLGGSEYLVASGYGVMGPVPHLDLELEARLQDLVLTLNEEGWLHCAHDVSDGGLLVTLLEAAFVADIGLEVDLPSLPVRTDVFLFGEGGSRVVTAVDPSRVQALKERARERGVPVWELGHTGGRRLTVRLQGELLVDEPLEDLKRIWQRGLTRRMEAQGEAVEQGAGHSPAGQLKGAF